MYFSVGILYSALDFLKLVKSTPGLDQRFPDMFRRFSVASAAAVLDVSQKCLWVCFNPNGYLEITPRGQILLSSHSPEDALRQQIKHLVEAYNPPWVPLLTRGRAEAVKYLPPDVQQCLREADLLTPPTYEIIRWWDALAETTRKQQQDDRIAIGRQGEQLSVEYERERTKREPIWQAIESNLSGYDILSVVDERDRSQLRIEVKTSNSIPSVAAFHVTRNEWVVAQTSEYYVFHLWALQPRPRLFVAEIELVSHHIPKNYGTGRWESVMIPFEAVISGIQEDS